MPVFGKETRRFCNTKCAQKHLQWQNAGYAGISGFGLFRSVLLMTAHTYALLYILEASLNLFLGFFDPVVFGRMVMTDGLEMFFEVFEGFFHLILHRYPCHKAHRLSESCSIDHK